MVAVCDFKSICWVRNAQAHTVKSVNPINFFLVYPEQRRQLKEKEKILSRSGGKKMFFTSKQVKIEIKYLNVPSFGFIVSHGYSIIAKYT